MLPVKSPKVPPTATVAPPPVSTATATEGPAFFSTGGTTSTALTRDSNKRTSDGDVTDIAFEGRGEATTKTAVISKLLPNMKR